MGIRHFMSSTAPLEKLERTIAKRAAKPNEKSYTSKLLTAGLPLMGAKITEEAAEVVEAAGEPGDAGREHFVREVGDLVFHLLVLMQDRKCSLADLGAELSRRFGVSGLAEKASRKPAESEAAASPTEASATVKKSKKSSRPKRAGKKTATAQKKAKAKSKPKKASRKTKANR
jgi:phosphoribosyl-ATP pyrophosphohydrolase